MDVVILARGLTRLVEETILNPKSMVEIGGKPILWHIMNIYAHQEFTEFSIALGYKGEVINDYFMDFYALNNDISVDLVTENTSIYGGKQPNWKVHLIDTGLNTMTGRRIRRLQKWLESDEHFMLSYGDGVANVDVHKLFAFHKEHGKQATVTMVRPPVRFSGIRFEGNRVVELSEKSTSGEGWINDGFFVLKTDIFDYIRGDDTIDTIGGRESLEELTNNQQLMAYRHDCVFVDVLLFTHLKQTSSDLTLAQFDTPKTVLSPPKLRVPYPADNYIHSISFVSNVAVKIQPKVLDKDIEKLREISFIFIALAHEALKTDSKLVYFDKPLGFQMGYSSPRFKYFGTFILRLVRVHKWKPKIFSLQQLLRALVKVCKVKLKVIALAKSGIPLFDKESYRLNIQDTLRLLKAYGFYGFALPPWIELNFLSATLIKPILGPRRVAMLARREAEYKYQACKQAEEKMQQQTVTKHDDIVQILREKFQFDDLLKDYITLLH